LKKKNRFEEISVEEMMEKWLLFKKGRSYKITPEEDWHLTVLEREYFLDQFVEFLGSEDNLLLRIAHEIDEIL